MDNNLPQSNFSNANQAIQKPSFWVSNPNLKLLLGVLIFVFLGCGIGLAIFAQWSNQYRQQVYEETQAGLPVHQEKATTLAPTTTAPTVLADGRLQVDSPKEGDTVGQTFTVSGYAQDWFEATIAVKVYDGNNNLLYSGSAMASQDNYGKVSPFSGQVILTATSTTSAGKIEFNDYSAKDGSLVYQKVVNIKFAGYAASADTTEWKSYKNTQYGFEFRYPAGWSEPQIVDSILALGCPKIDFEGIMRCPLHIDISTQQTKADFLAGLKGDQYFADLKVVDKKVNGIDAIKYFPLGAYQVTETVFFNKKLSVSVLDDFDTYQKNGIYDSILETFKFTK